MIETEVFDYYKAPEDKIFNDIKQNAIKIWSTYDDTYKYATEKISRIKDLENIKDNAYYIIAMFDSENQAKLMYMVHQETQDFIYKYLKAQIDELKHYE